VTKAVVWSSCSRLSCASAQSPDVVICVTDSALLAPYSCGSETFVPSTLDGVLAKVWKDGSVCGTGLWRYLLNYDETLLADPTTPLTAAQISSVFCKGCLTTWVEDAITKALCDNGLIGT
jgi:hypothetical protein